MKLKKDKTFSKLVKNITYKSAQENNKLIKKQRKTEYNSLKKSIIYNAEKGINTVSIDLYETNNARLIAIRLFQRKNPNFIIRYEYYIKGNENYRKFSQHYQYGISNKRITVNISW